MSNSDETPIGAGKTQRIELRVVIVGVLALLIIGALYVALRGSPAKDRAVIDSPDAQPAPMYQKVPPNPNAAPSPPASR